MHNITLISTRHEQIGKCNADELYRIIEKLKPDVIFEEMPPSYFDRYYLQRTRWNLESDTITAYAETYNIHHVPVDSEEMPNDSFFWAHEKMHNRIEMLGGMGGFDYRNSIDRNRDYIALYGFDYLNSDYSIACNDEIYNATIKGLEKINDGAFFQTHKMWSEIHERRENKMLDNIYSYCMDHNFESAIFLLGVAHRKSISNKIRDREKKQSPLLTWTIYVGQIER